MSRVLMWKERLFPSSGFLLPLTFLRHYTSMCNITAAYSCPYATALLIISKLVQLQEETYLKWCRIFFPHCVFRWIFVFNIEISRS